MAKCALVQIWGQRKKFRNLEDFRAIMGISGASWDGEDDKVKWKALDYLDVLERLENDDSAPAQRTKSRSLNRVIGTSSGILVNTSMNTKVHCHISATQYSLGIEKSLSARQNS
ncbi:hypothetical protein M9H77_12140 [Catharanthus roseus]|uniref:Uncharacterized protein n=1 Tax=Catharanthus roseus TaxID=4058 RepID=A0ACC0BGI6_CATRO|nr:hypothetical protein M9H77_12140 [Catharanthus roseus]